MNARQFLLNPTLSTSSLLLCPTCEQPFDSKMGRPPKLLKCGHTFCPSCLARVARFDSVSYWMDCAVCSQRTKLDKFSTLPNNDFVASIDHIVHGGLIDSKTKKNSRKKKSKALGQNQVFGKSVTAAQQTHNLDPEEALRDLSTMEADGWLWHMNMTRLWAEEEAAHSRSRRRLRSRGLTISRGASNDRLLSSRGSSRGQSRGKLSLSHQQSSSPRLPSAGGKVASRGNSRGSIGLPPLSLGTPNSPDVASPSSAASPFTPLAHAHTERGQRDADNSVRFDFYSVPPHRRRKQSHLEFTVIKDAAPKHYQVMSVDLTPRPAPFLAHRSAPMERYIQHHGTYAQRLLKLKTAGTRLRNILDPPKPPPPRPLTLSLPAISTAPPHTEEALAAPQPPPAPLLPARIAPRSPPAPTPPRQQAATTTAATATAAGLSPRPPSQPSSQPSACTAAPPSSPAHCPRRRASSPERGLVVLPPPSDELSPRSPLPTFAGSSPAACRVPPTTLCVETEAGKDVHSKSIRTRGSADSLALTPLSPPPASPDAVGDRPEPRTPSFARHAPAPITAATAPSLDHALAQQQQQPPPLSSKAAPSPHRAVASGPLVNAAGAQSPATLRTIMHLHTQQQQRSPHPPPASARVARQSPRVVHGHHHAAKPAHTQAEEVKPWEGTEDTEGVATLVSLPATADDSAVTTAPASTIGAAAVVGAGSGAGLPAVEVFEDFEDVTQLDYFTHLERAGKTLADVERENAAAHELVPGPQDEAERRRAIMAVMSRVRRRTSVFDIDYPAPVPKKDAPLPAKCTTEERKARLDHEIQQSKDVMTRRKTVRRRSLTMMAAACGLEDKFAHLQRSEEDGPHTMHTPKTTFDFDPATAAATSADDSAVPPPAVRVGGVPKRTARGRRRSVSTFDFSADSPATDPASPTPATSTTGSHAAPKASNGSSSNPNRRHSKSHSKTATSTANELDADGGVPSPPPSRSPSPQQRSAADLPVDSPFFEKVGVEWDIDYVEALDRIRLKLHDPLLYNPDPSTCFRRKDPYDLMANGRTASGETAAVAFVMAERLDNNKREVSSILFDPRSFTLKSIILYFTNNRWRFHSSIPRRPLAEMFDEFDAGQRAKEKAQRAQERAQAKRDRAERREKNRADAAAANLLVAATAGDRGGGGAGGGDAGGGEASDKPRRKGARRGSVRG